MATRRYNQGISAPLVVSIVSVGILALWVGYYLFGGLGAPIASHPVHGRAPGSTQVAAATDAVPFASTSTDVVTKELEEVYHGKILAGTVTKLIDFTQDDYIKAATDGKLIVLYFYASSSTLSIEGFKDMASAFEQMDTPNVVGFRVDFDTSAVDEYEQALAERYGVQTDDTKVFIKDGERVLKTPEHWDPDRYVTETNVYNK